jgi:molybdopterin-guanine dinucleotide biosynthesis protein B
MESINVVETYYNGPMHRIHIIGRKNIGKTTLVVDLVHHFRALGYRVGTIKHTHHHHELDTPGKDSFRHRQAGAKAVGIVAPTMSAIFWPTPSDMSGGAEERKACQLEQEDPAGGLKQADDLSRQYEPFDALMADCDLVLVEGDQQAQAVKIEVWHQGVEERPLAENNPSIALVVSNDPVNAQETHRCDDLQSLGQRLLELAEIDLSEYRTR